MKRVLILSPFFFPELISTGKYNTELAIQLRKQNLEVEVCAHILYIQIGGHKRVVKKLMELK